ncbi:hypothetical protein HPB49_023523 [Dermacentor silvarum]|uniref:Uncharacterized protein n=1 Tax=Dermacentor silvarum TaxID=543639 RepID=A0ACB8DGN6_DERSI|nr:hypothetical protein HPB49_023523 [Dermacentor silvarum]
MTFNGTVLRVAYVKVVDISPGPFIMTSSRLRVANPSFPWAYENMIIFAAKPLHFTTNVFGFANAFSGVVWLTSAATLLLLWLVFTAILSKSPSDNLGVHAGGRAFHRVPRHWRWSRALGTLVRPLLSQGFENLPYLTLPRCLITVWLLAIIVMRTSFLGEMKAALVVRTEVTGIRSMEDLAKKDRVTPVVLRGSAFYSFVKGEAAMIFTESPVAAMMSDRCEQLVPLNAELYYAPKAVTQLPMSMFMRRGLDDSLRRAIGEKIELFMERGFIAKFYRDSRLEIPPCRRLTAQSHVGDSAGPQLDSLQGVFLMLLAGLLIAAAALLAEIFWHRAGRRGGV